MLKIAFCGKSGAGKTTACEYIKQRNANTEILSFATPLKEIQSCVIKTFDLPDKKYRDLLQLMGAWIRNTTRSEWSIDANRHPILKKMREQIDECVANGKNIIIDDLRMQNEHIFLKEMGFLCFKIVGRQNNWQNMDGGNPTHVTETDLDQYNFCLVKNDTDLNTFYNVLNNVFFLERVEEEEEEKN